MTSRNCLVVQCSPKRRQWEDAEAHLCYGHMPTPGSVPWVMKRFQIPHTQVKSYSGNSSYFRQNDGNRHSMSL